jgi:FHS family L-fucose permease-like MFS transporter
MITPVQTTNFKSGNGGKGGLFRLPDGRSMLVTFILVTSLFLLWGFCNGMIDM